MLEPGDAVDRLLVAGRVLVSLSSGGKYLRGWSLKDGTLLWEAVTYTAAAPSAEAAKERGADRGVDLLPLGRDADGDGAEDVLVLARGEVQMRSLSDGVIAWTAEAATRCDDERGDAGDDVARFNRLAVVGADDSIVAVGATAERGHPVAAEIDSTSGAIRRVAIATGVQGLDAISKMTVSATDAKEGVAVFGAARDAGAGADEAPTKLFALDLGKLLALAGSRGAGKDVASVFAVPTALELGAPGGTIKLEPVRGADGAGDVAAARAGAALASGSESCALIAMDPVADGSASRKPADRMRALASWPLDSSGACPAAVSPAAFLDRADTKQASKTAPAARREVVFARARRRGVAACFSQREPTADPPGARRRGRVLAGRRPQGRRALSAGGDGGRVRLAPRRGRGVDARRVGGARRRGSVRASASAEERGGGCGGRLARPPQLPREPSDADPRREGAVQARHEG